MRLTVVLCMNIVLPPCTGPLYLPQDGTGEVTSRRIHSEAAERPPCRPAFPNCA